MSLTIELSPAEEQTMLSFAQKAGLPAADFAHRLFVDALQKQSLGDRRTQSTRQARRTEIAQTFSASGVTETELEQHAQQIVDEVRTAHYVLDSQPK